MLASLQLVQTTTENYEMKTEIIDDCEDFKVCSESSSIVSKMENKKKKQTHLRAFTETSYTNSNPWRYMKCKGKFQPRKRVVFVQEKRVHLQTALFNGTEHWVTVVENSKSAIQCNKMRQRIREKLLRKEGST